MARIAIGIEDVNQRGGQERVVCELARRLAGRHELDLICYTAEDIPTDEINVIRLSERFRFSSFLRAIAFIRAASRWVARGDYDAILSQGSNMSNQRFVLAHTCHAQRIIDRRENEWKAHPPSLAKRIEFAARDAILRRLERKTMLRHRGRIIAVGHELKQKLMRHYGLDDDEIFVAENGVDHERFTPANRERWRSSIRRELNLSEDTFVVLFVGGLWHEKGVSLLIEALPRMRYRDVSLVVVGDGDVDDFGGRAKAFGVRDRVVFAGRTPHPERYYAMADCFAFLSKAEGLALVQAEAAASGLPLLLTEGLGPPGLVEEGVSGFRAAYTPESVAEKLDILAADPELRRRAGEASHRNSLSFSWDAQAKTIESILLDPQLS